MSASASSVDPVYAFLASAAAIVGVAATKQALKRAPIKRRKYQPPTPDTVRHITPLTRVDRRIYRLSF
jgi:hypothetical protein